MKVFYWRESLCLACVLLSAILMGGCASNEPTIGEAVEINDNILAIETPTSHYVAGLGIGFSHHQQRLAEDFLYQQHRTTKPNEIAFGYQGPFLDQAFDRNWFYRDQQRFSDFYQLPDNYAKQLKCYHEIIQLRNHQQRIIARVEEKHPYYRIFGPEETDQINSLFIAIAARQNWLRDQMTGNGTHEWQDYYPAEYTYRFFQMGSLNIQGGVDAVEIQVLEDFSAYDEAAIVAFLDTLPVPGKVYQGKEFFFVNGANEDYGAVHANGQIIVFNLFDETEEIFKLIGHEIGHDAGYLIFGRDGYENEKEEMKEAYASLHGRQVPHDERVPWELRLSENFAEDFVWVYGGFDKWSYWQAADKDTIRNFIETSLAEANLEEAVLIRDNIQLIAGHSAQTLFGGINEDNLFIVRDKEISISLDGFYRGVYGVFVHRRNNVTGNLPRQPFNQQGRVSLTLAELPEEQQRLEEEGFVVYEMQLKMYHYTSLQKFHQPTFARFFVVYWPEA